MPTCDYCGFIVPDPCYSFDQMARRSCPVLTVPIESTQDTLSFPKWDNLSYPTWDKRCKQSTFKVAINEGGDWDYFTAHTMVMPDGSEWDAVNGWRKDTLPKVPKPSGPPLEAPAPKCLAAAHWDIWRQGYVAPGGKKLADYISGAPVAPVPVYAPNPPKSDPINHPHHYARWAIEPIEFISLNKLPAWLANVIKYSMRYDAKDGLKDLYKGRSYLDMEIRRLEGVERFWEVPVAEERRLNAA